jgi:hypothetical protein
MNLYQIFGLTVSTFMDTTYETKSNNRIVIDENGKGITKPKIFTKYILYGQFENKYYAIHLSDNRCASASGILSSCGNMEIIETNFLEIQSNITHEPITPLVISPEVPSYGFENRTTLFLHELKNYHYDCDIRICLHEEPNTCLFNFSYFGGDEARPCGFVYVNMELFHKL